MGQTTRCDFRVLPPATESAATESAAAAAAVAVSVEALISSHAAMTMSHCIFVGATAGAKAAAFVGEEQKGAVFGREALMPRELLHELSRR